uniref:Uncharacterized protein n=1 Tax=Acanthochromis polyacanthus TaxID=80966 RepID=A0A3Q1F071_9TELE
MKNPKTTQSQPSGVVRNNILKRLAQSSHHSKCKVTSDYSLQVSTDVCEQAVPAPHNHPSAAEQASADTLTSSTSDKSSASSRKRRIQMRRLRHTNTQEEQEQEEDESDSAVEEMQHVDRSLQSQNQNQDSSVLAWESSSWPKQQEDVSEHLCQGGLYQDSIYRRFTFDEKNVLLQWSNLQPTRWTAEQTADSIPPALCPGYYQVTILGINKKIAFDAAYLPVVRSDDPRAVGLPQDPHGNTMLSCLSSGFLCPLRDAASHSEAPLPEPEEILVTASELEDTHVVCVLDLCHLGGDEVEILISKVYRVTEVSLD